MQAQDSDWAGVAGLGRTMPHFGALSLEWRCVSASLTVVAGPVGNDSHRKHIKDDPGGNLKTS